MDWNGKKKENKVSTSFSQPTRLVTWQSDALHMAVHSLMPADRPTAVMYVAIASVVTK